MYYMVAPEIQAIYQIAIEVTSNHDFKVKNLQHRPLMPSNIVHGWN